MPPAEKPRDQDGLTIPHDHEEIAPNHLLVRRISSEFVTETDDGRRRISSAIFSASSIGSDRYEGISVDLESVAVELGVDLRMRCDRDPKALGAVSLDASSVRAENLTVGYDPEIGNACHGQVWGKPNGGKRKRLLQRCNWYCEIPEVDLRNQANAASLG